MLRVLSIDGGGIRGVIPAVLLQHLEEKVGKPIAEMFDLVVGTSTGGILACGLTVPASANAKQPKFTAADMLKLYERDGHKIFERSFWKGVTSLGGLGDETYSAKPLEKLLKDYLGEATLKSVLTPLVVTAYDIERRQPYFFKSTKAEDPKRNHYLRDAARATSAAPTFFEPAVVRNVGGRGTRRILVDGGVFVNNPAMCAYAEAQELPGADQGIMMVSLGTGVATRKIKYKDAKDWGALGWVRPIISVMMDGEADAADYHMRILLRDEKHKSKQQYFRFDTELDLALDDMDAANTGNIRALKDESAQILRSQRQEMLRVIAMLS